MFKIVVVFLLFFVIAASGLETLFRRATIHTINTSGKRNNFNLNNASYLDPDVVGDVVTLKVATKLIPKLYPGAIRDLEDLEKLHLPACEIQEIARGAFRNLPNVEEINLQDNQIRFLDEGVFNVLPALNRLHLHRNKITRIHSKAFDNMPSLVEIKLNNNKIKEWDNNWFFNSPKVGSLYFRRNRIVSIPFDAFKNLKSTHDVKGRETIDLSIYLSKNHISHIHPSAFHSLTKISQLWLDRNNLTSIDIEVFNKLEYMALLYLRKNKISALSENMFDRLEAPIKILDITKNKLSCLPETVVKMALQIDIEGNKVDCECLNNLHQLIDQERWKTKINPPDCEQSGNTEDDYE